MANFVDHRGAQNLDLILGGVAELGETEQIDAAVDGGRRLGQNAQPKFVGTSKRPFDVDLDRGERSLYTVALNWQAG